MKIINDIYLAVLTPKMFYDSQKGEKNILSSLKCLNLSLIVIGINLAESKFLSSLIYQIPGLETDENQIIRNMFEKELSKQVYLPGYYIKNLNKLIGDKRKFYPPTLAQTMNNKNKISKREPKKLSQKTSGNMNNNKIETYFKTSSK